MGELEAALKPFADAEADRAGIFTDFDGCLAPIVPDPEDARAVRGASTALARLARRYRVVAVVSGRTAADLSRRVRAPGVRLIGLHGMEEIRDGVVVTSPRGESARKEIERAGARLEESLRGVRGAILERKGLALAVHFRRASDPEAVERLVAPIVRVIAADAGLEVMSGRRILEVRPPGAGDKGDAVRAIVTTYGLRAALVCGDDVGDIAAFSAVEDLPVRVRIVVASDESPAELVERAEVVAGSPHEVVKAFRSLART
jgi:trehalose 6-phosphate phosphatase